MELQKVMQELNLSELESKAYLTLLKLGQSMASKVAGYTKMNRSLSYQILDSLIKKGLASYVIRENRRYYSAVHPEKLLNMLKEKEAMLKEAIPELVAIYTPSDKPAVEILEGSEGIKTILKDILKVNESWFALGSSGRATEILPFYIDHWERERKKQGISLKAVLDSSEQAKKRGKELSKLTNTEIRYLKDKFDTPTSTWIYGDRVAIIMWNKEHSFAIRTISKEIAKNYKNYLELLWKMAKK